MKPSKVFGPVTLRCAPDCSWWALNKRETGWASFGYRFDFLTEALEAFDLRLESFGRDSHGLYLVGIPR
jgi:hypothetical protein